MTLANFDDISTLGNVLIHYIFPNHCGHGPMIGWQLESEQIDAMMMMKDPHQNLGDNKDHPDEFVFSGYIVAADKQQVAERIINQHGKLVWEGYEHFTQAEGMFRFYHKDCGKMKLVSSEEPYVDNKRHGKRIFYYKSGRINDECIYNMGIMQGPRYEFNENGITFSNYVDGKLDGVVERYERLDMNATREELVIVSEIDFDGCDYPFLATRAHFKNGEPHGTYEIFNPVSGVRVHLAQYLHGENVEQSRDWDSKTGVCTAIDNWKDGKREDHQLYDSETGAPRQRDERDDDTGDSGSDDNGDDDDDDA